MRIADHAAVRAWHDHPHFWDPGWSRRKFLGASAAATGAALTTELWLPVLARADDEGEGSAAPTPIPEVLFPGTPFHVQFPLPGNDQSTINNFKGAVASTQVSGTGTMRDTNTGATSQFFFGSDMRYMKGTYIGVDGESHKGTFVFV